MYLLGIKIWLTRSYTATGYVCYNKNLQYLCSDRVLKHYIIDRNINSVRKGQLLLFLRIREYVTKWILRLQVSQGKEEKIVMQF